MGIRQPGCWTVHGNHGRLSGHRQVAPHQLLGGFWQKETHGARDRSDKHTKSINPTTELGALLWPVLRTGLRYRTHVVPNEARDKQRVFPGQETPRDKFPLWGEHRAQPSSLPSHQKLPTGKMFSPRLEAAAFRELALWSGVAAGTRQPEAEPAQPSPCCHPSIPVPSQAAPGVGSHIPECKRPGPGTASRIASPCSRSCRGERSSRLRCGLAWVAWGGGGGTCETAQARGDSPSASIAPRCVPATPLTSEISRQSKFWNEQKEQANKTHDYEAIGFVFEAFIPVEGKDGRKDLKVLTVIEAIAKELAKKDFPCCTLVLCIQCDGIPSSECTSIFCRNEPFPGRLTPCPCSWRFVWDVPAASTCLPRESDLHSRGRDLLVTELCFACGRAPGRSAVPRTLPPPDANAVPKRKALRMGEGLAQVDLSGGPVAGYPPVRKLSLELCPAFLKACHPGAHLRRTAGTAMS